MTTKLKSVPRRISRRILRVVLAGLLAIALLGALLPLISAGTFRASIQQAVEASLGRKIEFAKVHFTLFSGPGFSLEEVTIREDPRYGLEPFAHAASLQAHLRLDKLLFGQLRFSSLRLVDPSMNLVKASDGGWNVVELVERLSTPRRAPLNLFPAIEVSGARIDFRLGTRKTTLYIANSDLAIYPERSGKLYIRFSGSPARTDRAGNGFGHLRGTANWYVNPPNAQANQLEADVTLDPSNLSELTTLFQGHDAGVHGTISSHARIEGPAAALRISGELRLEDVHRWDLLPSAGEEWRIGYRGGIDLSAHRFDLETIQLRAADPAPVALQMRVNQFSRQPAWSIFLRLNHAAVKDVLPLSRRMGLIVPQGLAIDGTLDGVISYSNGAGMAGGVTITDAVATLPNLPPLRAAAANIAISADAIHFSPATIQTSLGGTLQAGGDYYLSAQRLIASVNAYEFPIGMLKSTVEPWFGVPPALAILQDGNITGKLVFSNTGKTPSSWSGQFQFANATLSPPGIAVPLTRSEGHVAFDNSTIDVSRFSANLGDDLLHVSYHYYALAKRRERIHVELPSVDLTRIEAALDPTLQAQGLLARLRFTRRSIPPWLAARDLEGDLTIHRFSINGTELGPLSARFIWQGTNVQFGSLQLNLPEGLVRAHGALNLTSYSPRYRFAATIRGFPWRGGLLNAEGEFETFGTGVDSLHHLHAGGTFSGEDINLSPDDSFSKVSGPFDFSFSNDWPNFHFSKLQASDGEDAWTGEAASQSDGKLIVDLTHEGQKRHLVSTLIPESPPAPPAVLSGAVPR